MSVGVRFQQSAQGVQSRGKRPLRIDPDGPGTAVSEQLEGLDERASVVWPDSLVVDLVFGPLWGAGPSGKTISKGGGVEV